MPAPGSVAEFVAVVRKSGLVPDDRLRTDVNRLATEPHPPGTVDQMAQALVRVGVLTKFQARQLKLGRYKRFLIANKYRLLELLGVGGMGAVYLCEHMRMKRLVALKILPHEKMSDPSNVERFYREARSVAALNDPNIVRAYDIDDAEGLHFLVMEYVDGASLQEIVARFGPQDPVRAASYIAQTANGLQHACELSMVHRDIKPGNLLLDRTGTVKILDMGLARFFADKTDNLTAKYDEKCVLGTADYLAPEQAMTNVVDTRADIYALGGTLYFLLTGKSPVPDGTIAQKLVYHQTKNPVPVEHLRHDLPPGLADVVRKMMAKEPEKRYQTPADVAEALSPWADPHLPPPPVHEMPDLCPVVLALSGHSADRVKAGGSSAARLSGPGRLILPKSGGSGATRTAAGGPNTPSRSVDVALAGAPTQAHVDTDRGSPTVAMPTTPTPSQRGPDSGVDGESDAKIDIEHPDAATPIAGLPAGRKARARKLSRLVIAVAAAAVLTALGVGVYAAVAGKPRPSAGETPAPRGPAAGGAVLTPEQARNHVGQERTVEFLVANVGGRGGGNMFFNSRTDHTDPDNFYAFVPATVVREKHLTVSDLKAKYEGKVVRVSGPIRLWKSKDVQIEVGDLGQIAIVGAASQK